MGFIKCHCGFQETRYREEEVDVLYKTGPKKGTFRKKDTITHYAQRMDTYEVPTITSAGEYFNEKHDVSLQLKVCPDCGLVYMDGWF